MTRGSSVWTVLVAVVVGAVPLVASGPGLPSAHSGADPLAQAAHLAHATRHLPWQSEFWNAPWLHPSPWSQLYLDPMVGPSLVARAVPGQSPVTDYRAVFWFTVASAVLAMTWCARRVGVASGFALLAGVVYAVGPYAAGHFHHLNQLPSPWFPLAMGALASMTMQGRSSGTYAIVFVTAFAAQLAWSVYATAALVLAAVVFLLFARRRAAVPRGALILVGAGSAMVLVLGAIPYVLAARDLPTYTRDASEVLAFQARWFDLWKAPASHLLPWPQHDPARPALYPGVVWSVLALLGACVRWRTPFTRAVVAAGAAGLLFAFGRTFLVPFTAIEIPLPFAGLQDLLWPLRALRDPSRFALVFAWATALLAAGGLAWVFARNRTVAYVLLGLAAVDLAPGRGERVDPALDTPVVGALATTAPGDVWVLLPAACDETQESARDARTMLWAVLAERSVAGGASGFVPPSIAAMRAQCCDPAAPSCVDALRGLGVDWIVSDRALPLDVEATWTDGTWSMWPVDLPSPTSQP